MNILIDINHPAQFHLFKHSAFLLEKEGHQVIFTVLEKEMTGPLFRDSGLDYRLFGKSERNHVLRVAANIRRSFQIYKYVRTRSIDIILSNASINAAHLSKVLRIPNISITDTERATLHRKAIGAKADCVLTPACFRKIVGKKQFSYQGLHELAYLSPKYFKPDADKVNALKLKPSEKYALLRFVSWNAFHDRGRSGLNPEQKIDLMKLLKNKGYSLLLSSEDPLPESQKKNGVLIPADSFHDALNQASVVITEGATVASEAAVLGCPVIYFSNLEVCTIDLLKSKQLMIQCRDYPALRTILADENSPKLDKTAWRKRSAEFVNSSSDLSELIVWFVHNYPGSIHSLEQNRKIQDRFRAGRTGV